MRIAAFVGALALACSGVGAVHAQAAGCNDVTKLMGSTHAQVKALQGQQIEDDAEEITYASKAGVAGFANCRLMSAKAADYNKYWKHHLWCDGSNLTADAADQAIGALWACTKDSLSERKGIEAWLGGAYRVIGFEGERQTSGKAAGLVEFTKSDYARMSVDKSFDLSTTYNLHIYWLFRE